MARPASLRRLQALVWVLIFGGLLTLVLGLSLSRYDADAGLALIASGSLLAAVGVLLIFVRARIREDGPDAS